MAVNQKNKISARKEAVLLLMEFLKEDEFLNTDIGSSLGIEYFDKRDRSFIVDIVHGTLRQLKYLDWILSSKYHKKWEKVPEKFRRAAETGLYQILFMDGVPDYAAINETVQIVKELNGKYWSGVANGILRAVVKNPVFGVELKKNAVEDYISIRYSHPAWFVNRMTGFIGEDETEQLCRADNKRPVFGIRINLNKVSREEAFSEILKFDKDAEQSEILDEFVRVKHIGPVINSEFFRKGFISVQDESAGIVAHLVDPQPGEIIADVAAAPGGKTCHINELSKGKSLVISMDLRMNRLKRISENCKRLGIDKMYIMSADALNLPVRSVDKILLDAPCTGLGVLSKRADLRWKRRERDVDNAVRLQKNLLESCARAVKTGGVLVYSTCTILPEENQKQIEQFLINHKEFSIEKAEKFVNSKVTDKKGFVATFPHIHKTDGSFAVRMKKNRGNDE
ncbi:16S rRNA (cytosine(967)-C(5))-methyltransferase RsmB [bacterium]|nr:16S rRNA (cytosine(967)-C(5))-methyltransferase RsmB [bacterium]